jgi:hypothetical protein
VLLVFQNLAGSTGKASTQQTERDRYTGVFRTEVRICFRASFYFYFLKYFLFKIIFLDVFQLFYVKNKK